MQPHRMSLFIPTIISPSSCWSDMVRQRQYILMLLAMFSVTACNYHGKRESGLLLEVTNFEAPKEQWNLVPLPGVEVLILWSGYQSNLVHGRSVCLKKSFVRSGPDGTYATEEWTVPKSRRTRGVEDIQADTSVFSPGFIEVSSALPSKRLAALGSNVRIFRRTTDPAHDGDRDQKFINARYCPTEP